MGAAALPMIMGAVSMGFQLKAAGEAQKQADLERQQYDAQREAIRVQGLQQEAAEMQRHRQLLQASIAQGAAQGQRNPRTGGTPVARDTFALAELDRTLSTIRSNTLTGIQYNQLGAAQSKAAAESKKWAAVGKAVQTGYSSYKSYKSIK